MKSTWRWFGPDDPVTLRDAIQAGATGIIICTAHAAMRPENLSSVGATLRELKLG